LNDNQIPSLDGIEAALAGSREKLTTIYLERNPCVSILHILYLFIECPYKSGAKMYHDLNISLCNYHQLLCPLLLLLVSFFLKIAVIVPYCRYYVQTFHEIKHFVVHYQKHNLIFEILRSSLQNSVVL
jgi:hypothetical protein